LAQQNQGKKTHWKLTFFDQTALSKAAINRICFYLLLLRKRERMAKKELFLIELVTFFFEKTTARKISKNDNQTYLRTSKQSAVTAKHERNFPQPVITTIQERRKKFVRETIDFSNFLYGLPLSWWIVVCHRRCQLTVFPLFHTPAYLVPYLVSTVA